MKVLAINGSPAGKNSITLHSVLYLEQHFQTIEFEVLDAGQQIKKIEKDFSHAKEALERADLILFCYPVYTFLVPSQLHRFIELIKENGVDLSGRYASQLTTSLHFYDITAHQFIRENCLDLKMHYIEGLSADMEDLLSQKGQKELRDYFRFVLWNMEQDGSGTDPAKQTAAGCPSECVPAEPQKEITTALVTDLSADGAGRLQKMIGRFVQKMPGDVKVIDLQEFPFAGGCLGCFHCAADGTCIYKDGFDTFLREKIQTADAIVYAYTVKDHSMGYLFKLFDDRQFCNGHRTVTMGKPVGYLVDGDLDREPNLNTLMEARAQVGGNYLAGIAASGEAADKSGRDASKTIDAIDRMAAALAYAVRQDYQPPKNFYGVGGLKIFRDLIYQMRGLMKEDHRFYKAHGFYDFPQKRKGRILGMYAVGAMMNNKRLSKKLGGKMTEGMILPYQKILRKD